MSPTQHTGPNTLSFRWSGNRWQPSGPADSDFIPISRQWLSAMVDSLEGVKPAPGASPIFLESVLLSLRHLQSLLPPEA